MAIITLSFGMNVCISFAEGIVRPNFIKHVEFNGEDERAYSTAVKELKILCSSNIWRAKSPSRYMSNSWPSRLTSMQEEENIKLRKDILKKGIFCGGKIFRFLGHSSNQLREKTCFMMEGSDEEIQSHLEHSGDFVEVSDVNTRAKKIGFLFSPSRYFVKVNEDPREKPDSTDGSQFMSRELAAKVRATMDVNHPEPSAQLVRYQGFQGILVLGTEDVNTLLPRLVTGEYAAVHQPTRDVTPSFHFGRHCSLFPTGFPRQFSIEKERQHSFSSRPVPRENQTDDQPTGDVTPSFQFGIHSRLFPTSRERVSRRQTCHASSSEGSPS